jgi:hypothetical protein
MKEYYFPNHVHFVIDGEAVVFMDVRADRYRMLIGRKAHTFISLLSYPSGIPGRSIVVRKSDSQSPEKTSELALVSELLDNQLLTREKHASVEVESEIPLPDAELISPSDSQVQGVAPIAVMRFFASCVIATWRLRYSSIESIISAIERQKRNRRGDDLVVLRDAKGLVATFMKLRPLFPRGFLCLFDSIALLEFLAMHGCFPNLVFAVRIQPWYAHCWVQYGRTAFNQDLDDTRDYIPLMSV